MGFPFEHGLHATLMAQRLAGLLGVDAETMSQTYYCCLLTYSGAPRMPTSPLRSSEETGPRASLQSSSGRRSKCWAASYGPFNLPILPPYRRAYEIARRLPKAARFLTGGPHFEALATLPR